jgi:dTDP-4-dehydrorhamnose reductase
MLSVLVTGASGLLGWSLLRELAPAGYRLLTPDLDRFDLLAPEAVEAYILAERPDVIIHAAAYTAVDRAESEPELALAVNGRGTGAVATAAARTEAYLIYVSTDYVFDGSGTRPHREDDPVSPQGVYGRSKLAGEEEVRGRAPRHLIARTSWIFGPARPNFVETMYRRAVAGESSRVVDDQVGRPTYTPHLAGALHRLLMMGVEGTIHAVNDGDCSWYGLTREIYRLAGRDPDLVTPISTAELGRPAPRPANSVLDHGRLTALLGAPLPHWREALEEWFRWRTSAEAGGGGGAAAESGPGPGGAI